MFYQDFYPGVDWKNYFQKKHFKENVELLRLNVQSTYLLTVYLMKVWDVKAYAHNIIAAALNQTDMKQMLATLNFNSSTED